MLTSRGYVWQVKALDPDLKPRVVGMILLGVVFASNFVFTWAIRLIACVCACTFHCASENHAGFVSPKLTAITGISGWVTHDENLVIFCYIVTS